MRPVTLFKSRKPKWIQVIRIPADGTQVHLASAQMVLTPSAPEAEYLRFDLDPASPAYLSPEHEVTGRFDRRLNRPTTKRLLPSIATWGDEGWKKRAIFGTNSHHIFYTKAREPLIPNKHVGGRVSGDIVVAEVAKGANENEWFYKDIESYWMKDRFLMNIVLSFFDSFSPEIAHGHRERSK